MSDTKTPNLDRVQRWQEFGHGLAPALPNADDRAAFLSLPQVRAAVALDIAEAVQAERRATVVLRRMCDALTKSAGSPGMTVDHWRGMAMGMAAAAMDAIAEQPAEALGGRRAT